MIDFRRTRCRMADLDAAWAAAEAALPDGWHILSLQREAGCCWRASADADRSGPWHERYRRAYGDTPADALRALAVAFGG